jgi:hypothetical protein
MPPMKWPTAANVPMATAATAVWRANREWRLDQIRRQRDGTASERLGGSDLTAGLES